MADTVKTIEDLNEEKQEALISIQEWISGSKKELLSTGEISKPYFYLAGYAGTGKTTLIKFLAEYLSTLKIGFATYTGKAASILQEKGIQDPTTIHSLIYKVEFDEETGSFEFFLDDESDILEFDLMVLDEVSMINEDLGKDLISYRIPMLVVGDDGQLSPVSGTGFFTKSKPDFNLKEIHRQALESGIIQISVDIRQSANIQSFNFFDYQNKFDDVAIRPYNSITDAELANADLVAVGTHRTRRSVIQRVRKHKGEKAYPQKGSTIVFTRNNKHSGLMNGHIKDVIAVKETSAIRLVEHLQKEIIKYEKLGKTRIVNNRETALKLVNKHPELHKRFLNVLIDVDGTPKWIIVYLGEFYQDATGNKAEEMPLFKETNRLIRLLNADYACYAYALTVHKLQGSQGDNLLFIDDGFGTFGGNSQEERNDLRKRWLYTGVTRASKFLTMAI